MKKKGKVVKGEKMTLAERIGRYLVSCKGDIVSYERLGSIISHARIELGLDDPKRPRAIYLRDLSTIMPDVRKFLELSFACTVWCVRGTGYKIADKKQTAVYTMRTVKTTAMWAERTGRLSDIVDRSYIPEAFEEVFGNADNARKLFVQRVRGFIGVWNSERKNAQKLLENKK